MKLYRPLGRRLALGAFAALVATLAYRGIQFGTEARAVVRHDCWVWTWFPFAPAWIGPYFSMFVLMGLPWVLLPEWRQVRRFAAALLAVAASGWVTFIVYPTACARTGAAGQPDYYQLLLELDRANNSLPCLHSAMAVLAAWVLTRGAPVFRGWAARAVLATWVAVISVSIVALRQHTDVDLLAGFVVGTLGAAGWDYGERPRRASTAG